MIAVGVGFPAAVKAQPAASDIGECRRGVQGWNHAVPPLTCFSGDSLVTRQESNNASIKGSSTPDKLDTIK